TASGVTGFNLLTVSLCLSVFATELPDFINRSFKLFREHANVCGMFGQKEFHFKLRLVSQSLSFGFEPRQFFVVRRRWRWKWDRISHRVPPPHLRPNQARRNGAFETGGRL